MPVTVRQRVREDPIVRRQQIVDEAMRVIGQHGYNGFTVQLLAEKCGLSNAGLLYYFGSKDALLIALLDEVERQETEAMIPLVSAAREMHEPTEASLTFRTNLLRSIVGRFAGHPELSRFAATLQSESVNPAHPAHNWFRDRHSLALGLFESMMDGLVPNPKIIARLLFAMMNGLGEQWLRDGQSFDLLSAWDEGVKALVKQGFGEHLAGKSITGEGA